MVNCFVVLEPVRRAVSHVAQRHAARIIVRPRSIGKSTFSKTLNAQHVAPAPASAPALVPVLHCAPTAASRAAMLKGAMAAGALGGVGVLAAAGTAHLARRRSESHDSAAPIPQTPGTPPSDVLLNTPSQVLPPQLGIPPLLAIPHDAAIAVPPPWHTAPVTAVPEPPAAALMLPALMCLLMLRKRVSNQ